MTNMEAVSLALEEAVDSVYIAVIADQLGDVSYSWVRKYRPQDDRFGAIIEAFANGNKECEGALNAIIHAFEAVDKTKTKADVIKLLKKYEFGSEAIKLLRVYNPSVISDILVKKFYFLRTLKAIRKKLKD
jgi:hypothetical protein